MASKEQSVTLLRRNKRSLVDAINSGGFDLDENARAADFPMYIKWGAGLLDVTVAANRKSDNKRFFFTVGEWQSLSATEQNLFLLRGVRVRACGESFVIAPDTITEKAWGARDKTVPDLHSYQSMRDLHTYFDAYTETQLIIAAFDGWTGNNITGAPAAEAAYGYRAYTLESDGLEDTSEWALPTQAHLILMFRFVNEINAVISAVWSSDFNIVKTSHWSCSRWTNNEVYRLDFQNGGSSYHESPALLRAVRPICAS